MNNEAHDMQMARLVAEDKRLARLAAEPLTFDRLRIANVERCEESFHALNRGPMQWGCATAGEAGELCNLLKKWERDGNVPLADIGREAADVVCYLDLLCARMGLHLGECVREKFNEVSGRMGSEVRL